MVEVGWWCGQQRSVGGSGAGQVVELGLAVGGGLRRWAGGGIGDGGRLGGGGAVMTARYDGCEKGEWLEISVPFVEFLHDSKGTNPLLDQI
jgi:hypothetical protein